MKAEYRMISNLHKIEPRKFLLAYVIVILVPFVASNSFVGFEWIGLIFGSLAAVLHVAWVRSAIRQLGNEQEILHADISILIFAGSALIALSIATLRVTFPDTFQFLFAAIFAANVFYLLFLFARRLTRAEGRSNLSNLIGTLLLTFYLPLGVFCLYQRIIRLEKAPIESR